MNPQAPATAQDSLLRRFDSDSRAYIAARMFLLVVLVLLYSLGIMSSVDLRSNDLYLGALGLLLIDTVVLFFLAAGTSMSFSRSIMSVLVPDLIAFSVLTYLGRTEDSFYAAILLMPIFYALVVSKRQAWLVGAGATTAYVIGVLARGLPNTPETALFLCKALVVPVVTVLVANAVDKQRMREEAVAGSAAETEHLNAQLRRRVHELQAVSEITEIIHSSLDFDRVGPQVLEIVAQAIGVTTCCLFVIDKANNETLFSATRGTGTVVTDASGITPYAESGDHLTCIPVFDHGSTMVLFCTGAEALEGLSAEERLVLSAVASELVVAVENSRLYRLTSRLAITDELTGLANYRQLQTRLDEELARARRYDKPLSLLMLDADQFKQFNDTQGHVAGDRALAELGPLISQVVREVDLVARYGGEEFSVLLPETDAAGAYVVGEKIREAIEMHSFADANGERVCHMTMSIGVATYPTHGGDKDSLLREADDALYHAKNGGRNRVRAPHRSRRPEPADAAAAGTTTDE